MSADPRYPLGPFTLEGPVTAGRRAAWIAEVAAAPAALRAAVAGLDDPLLDTPYREGGWTVRQVVHHVPDSHLNAVCRFRLALTEDRPTIKPYAEAAWAELPDARFVQGGTDVLVELNFGRSRPEALVNLAELDELRGWSRTEGELRLGAGLTYTQAMQTELAELFPALAEASRTVGSPQIRNRGTIGGNLGTASPAGDALPPLLVERALVDVASVRGVRTLPLEEFLLGVKRNALEPDELVTSVRVRSSGGPSIAPVGGNGVP